MELFERIHPPKVEMTRKQIMTDEKKKFFELVRRLHIYYRDQLGSALISTNKFDKSTKYFVRALRAICPISNADIPTLTLRDLEENFVIYKERLRPKSSSTAPAVTPDITGSRLEIMSVSTRASSSRKTGGTYSEYDAHCLIFGTFLKNVHNFRLFRQHVKMNIIERLRKVPTKVEETSMQTRTFGELEGLFSAWTTLLDRNNNVARLLHPDMKDKTEQLFENEQEVAHYLGILSLFPKLVDIVNKIEFALTKYEMSGNAQ